MFKHILYDTENLNVSLAKLTVKKTIMRQKFGFDPRLFLVLGPLVKALEGA